MSRPGETLYTLGGANLGETAKALRFRIDTINGAPADVEPATQWFPLSHIRTMTTAAPDSEDADEIKVMEWILIQKEII